MSREVKCLSHPPSKLAAWFNSLSSIMLVFSLSRLLFFRIQSSGKGWSFLCWMQLIFSEEKYSHCLGLKQEFSTGLRISGERKLNQWLAQSVRLLVSFDPRPVSSIPSSWWKGTLLSRRILICLSGLSDLTCNKPSNINCAPKTLAFVLFLQQSRPGKPFSIRAVPLSESSATKSLDDRLEVSA